MYHDTFSPAKKLRHVTVNWEWARVLDLGCNTGALGPYVMERGAMSYRGVESNAEWAAEGRRRYPTMNIITADVRDVGLDCDILVCMGLFHHLPDDAVAKILGGTTAHTVVTEQPMGGPFQTYKMRTETWYRQQFTAAGFPTVRRERYGFDYAVDRAFLIATRARPDDNTINITDDANYWTALKSLPAAIAAMVHDGNAAPYITYWMRRTKQDKATATARAVYVQELIGDIRENGFKPDLWHGDVRQFDFATQGFGPIVVLRSPDGKTIPRDGSHRASILKALGRPVIAQVWSPA